MFHHHFSFLTLTFRKTWKNYSLCISNATEVWNKAQCVQFVSTMDHLHWNLCCSVASFFLLLTSWAVSARSSRRHGIPRGGNRNAVAVEEGAVLFYFMAKLKWQHMKEHSWDCLKCSRRMLSDLHCVFGLAVHPSVRQSVPLLWTRRPQSASMELLQI